MVNPPLKWTDAASLLHHFPHLTEKHAHYIAGHKKAPMMDVQKQEFLSRYAKGTPTHEILKSMSLTGTCLKVTRLIDREFDSEIRRVHANLKRKVESVMFQYATGQCKVTKKTYVALLDEGGAPMVDEYGEPVMYLQRKEVSQLPPQPTLIQFFLEAHFPERYGEQRTNDTMPPTPMEIEDQLTKVAEKVFKIV